MRLNLYQSKKPSVVGLAFDFLIGKISKKVPHRMNKTVLIVDDDEMLRKTLKTGLERLGFCALTADCADVAQQILDKINVDVIVLDRMMVGMDGLTFLKHLRTSGNNTPTIMLTAMSGAENTIDGLSCGADDYMSKPFQFQELVLRINNITKHMISSAQQMPPGLIYAEDEFFVQNSQNEKPKLIALSGEEKKLLLQLTQPVGNIVAAAPMVAKRLRNKLNVVLSNIDIVTIRSRGYKLICSTNNKTQGTQKI